jgi:hypothetical protein
MRSRQPGARDAPGIEAPSFNPSISPLSSVIRTRNQRPRKEYQPTFVVAMNGPGEPPKQQALYNERRTERKQMKLLAPVKLFSIRNQGLVHDIGFHVLPILFDHQ